MPRLEEPDKGYAWVVAFSACIINMILSGLSRMIGLLYVACIDAYGISRQEATLPFTIRNAVRCLSGPIAGIAGQYYGIRTVTFWGGIMAALGAGLCCLAPNITWLTLFWGGIHGLGFALANTLFQVVVNQYFEKNKATATGIALSGACVGSFGLPFLLEATLNTFGLSGAFLIISGIVMHVLPPTLFLKTPPWIENPEKYEKQRRALLNYKGSVMPDSKKTLPLKQQDDVRNVRSISFSSDVADQLDVSRFSLKRIRTKAYNFVKLASLKSSQGGDNVVCTRYISKETSFPTKDVQIEASSQNNIIASSVYTIPLENCQESNGYSTNNKSEKASAHLETPKFKDSLIVILQLHTNPLYLFTSISMAIYGVVFIPILTVLVDYSKDKGIDEAAGKYLINVMAAGDLAGRLCFGWVTDRGFMTIPNFMTLSLSLEGVFIALFPVAQTLSTFMILVALYGITAGCMLVQFPVLVCKYVDKKVQSVAMGCIIFLSGIISFFIPFLIGHFRDDVGSYDGMFYLTGAISVISGAMWLLEPFIAKCYKSKTDKITKDNNSDYTQIKPEESISK